MVDNRDHGLKAGDYAQVKFLLPHADASVGQTVELPTSALLFRKSGMEAAVVGPNDHVRIQPVTVGRDFGTSIEVTSGLTPADHVINNPPDSISGGDLVRVIGAKDAENAGDAHAAG
jgi:multidrug efflux pump subunit AcrA (membrane-fusion protein)